MARAGGSLGLMSHAAPHLRPLIHFLLCTGARLSEALYLDWSDVDLPAAVAVFRDTKNSRDRAAALPPLAVMLANLPYDDEGLRTRSGPVFRRDDGEPYVDRQGLEGGQIKRPSPARVGARDSSLGSRMAMNEQAQPAPAPQAPSRRYAGAQPQRPTIFATLGDVVLRHHQGHAAAESRRRMAREPHGRALRAPHAERIGPRGRDNLGRLPPAHWRIAPRCIKFRAAFKPYGKSCLEYNRLQWMPAALPRLGSRVRIPSPAP